MKTIVLHLCEEERSWAAKDLRLRYVQALQNTVFSLDAKFIEHYFIEDENLLSEKDIPDRELHMIKEYFGRLVNNYNL